MTAGPGRCTCCCGGRFDLVLAVEKAFSIKNGRAPSTAKAGLPLYRNPFAMVTALPVAIINHFRQCRTSRLNAHDFLQVFYGFGEGETEIGGIVSKMHFRQFGERELLR